MLGFKLRKFGTLSAITTLLVFSAGFRILGSAGLAFALDGDNGAVAQQSIDADKAEDDRDLDVLLASFQAREDALLEDEDRQRRRADQLKRAEAAIAAKVQELEQTERRLRELLAIADEAAEDDVEKLTTVYENMKPKAAATVFEQMPPAFAAGFLSRMGPEAAASVMASLTPQTAYAISVVFAGRNAGSDDQ